MSYLEKIDVLDILINLLTDYEKRIDELVNRLEILVEYFEVDGSVPEITPGFESYLVDVIEDEEGTISQQFIVLRILKNQANKKALD